ncbi:MAG TPA: hypothetical protein PKX31_00320 [Chitinophagaceae bacterium]|nr:hypothetical protein [Chitinophagaceae bacterium]
MKIIKVIQPQNGWDNVICMADSIEAAAYELECETIEEFRYAEKVNKWIVQECVLSTLPGGCKTLKESVEKYW